MRRGPGSVSGFRSSLGGRGPLTYVDVVNVVREVHVDDGETFLDGPITVPSEGIVLAGVNDPKTLARRCGSAGLPVQRRLGESLQDLSGGDNLHLISVGS